MEAITSNIPKLVRLTFHDCLEEVSGAGCNGCLNFEGMKNVYTFHQCAPTQTCRTIDKGTRPTNRPFRTDNNNLFWVAQVLESVYQN